MKLSKFIFLLLIVIYILLSTECFDYYDWNIQYSGYILAFLTLIIVIISIKNYSYLSGLDKPLSSIVVCLVSIPLLSVLLGENSSLYSELFNHYLPLLIFSVFYAFYAQGINEKDLVKVFTVLGIIISFIQIIQVLFPQYAIFGIYKEDNLKSIYDIAEIRNGLYRYSLETYFITLFCLYYYWDRLRSRFSLKTFLIFSIFLVSMYLYLTRQIMFATVATLGVSFFFIRNSKTKWFTLLLIGVLFTFLFNYSDLILGSIIEQTRDEMDGSNIRMLSMNFYYNKIIENPIYFFAGHGHPTDLQYWREVLRFFPNDVGFVGETFYYGIFWFILYVYTIYTILVKYGTSVPLYIQLFVFGTMINSIMIFPYRSDYEFLVWASVLYISSLYITRDKMP